MQLESPLQGCNGMNIKALKHSGQFTNGPAVLSLLLLSNLCLLNIYSWVWNPKNIKLLTLHLKYQGYVVCFCK